MNTSTDYNKKNLSNLNLFGLRNAIIIAMRNPASVDYTVGDVVRMFWVDGASNLPEDLRFTLWEESNAKDVYYRHFVRGSSPAGCMMGEVIGLGLSMRDLIHHSVMGIADVEATGEKYFFACATHQQGLLDEKPIIWMV